MRIEVECLIEGQQRVIGFAGLCERLRACSVDLRILRIGLAGIRGRRGARAVVFGSSLSDPGVSDDRLNEHPVPHRPATTRAIAGKAAGAEADGDSRTGHSMQGQSHAATNDLLVARHRAKCTRSRPARQGSSSRKKQLRKKITRALARVIKLGWVKRA